MTTLQARGDRISGEKILWWFGAYSEPATRGGGVGGRFWNHGGARVLKAVKRSQTMIPQSSDEIRCKAATYEAGAFEVKPERPTVGAHRCYTGVLKRRASCERAGGPRRSCRGRR